MHDLLISVWCDADHRARVLRQRHRRAQVRVVAVDGVLRHRDIELQARCVATSCSVRDWPGQGQANQRCGRPDHRRAQRCCYLHTR